MYLVLCAILADGSASAEVVYISTDSVVTNQQSVTFGDWVFEVVDPPSPGYGLNLIPPHESTNTTDESFIVSNACCGGDFTLKRTDGSRFSLLSIYAAVQAATDVGEVRIVGQGTLNFQESVFVGEPGVSNVDSILFSPINIGNNGIIQLSRFEAIAVPEPFNCALLLAGIAPTMVRRWRKRAAR